MSVFNDFQRLWMQRFPKSSLSDAWEQDVRASLDRHKEKITELTKELEQEKLYVEYLERLLADVEKFRESGGDPSTLFEAATTPTTTAAGVAESSDNEMLESGTDIDIDEAANDDAQNNGQRTEDAASADNNKVKSSLNLRDSSGNNNENKDKNSRLSLNTDNKYASNNNNNNNFGNVGGGVSSSGIKKTSSPTTAPTTSNEFNGQQQSFDKDSGTEKEQQRNNGALQQCISELAAGMKCEESGKGKTDKNSTSHFVTVIEVKESKFNSGGGMGLISENDDANNSQDNHDNNHETTPSHSTTSTFSSFERKNSMKLETAVPPSSSSTSPSMSASSYAAHLEAKKKMPPRPPPKNMRRVEPPTIPGTALSSSPKRDSPFAGSQIPLPQSSGSFSSSESAANSLERNIKPSDILRQKSESLEAKQQGYASNRKTTPEMLKFANTPELVEEFGRKIGKSESLEKTKRSELGANQSPNSSLGRTVSSPSRSLTPGRSSVTTATGASSASPTSSLNKSASKLAADAATTAASTSSLDKKQRSSLKAEDSNAEARNAAGSKESLASQGISDIIKSYESVSSLSSEGTKATGIAIDNEPYYDTVPMDNGDGEYVYIKPGGTGSSSSRDDLSTPGSSNTATLPIGSTTQGTEPESPGRSSNYVNINYFIQSQKDARSSSFDSDNEYEGPPIIRTISHDEQTSQTPGALRKVSGNARGAKIRSILSSIIHSETIYVECLNKMLQYKKAINATLKTSQPVIKVEEQNTIFFKIDELHALHTGFLHELKTIAGHDGGDVLIGETFKRLADNFNLYSAFLHNYGQAIDTVKKCCANNPQFKQIVSTIVLNLQTEQSLTLEDLLHKPVARVQINALVFKDLLDETPSNHPDHFPLKHAHKTIHMFLKQFNVVDQRLPTESNKNLRRMVKNSFIVESVDGHRKLRHLFLFNDVIACAKYKASARGIDHELKWFIPLKDITVYEDTGDANNDPKDVSAFNILQLKTQASTVRDQIMLEERDGKGRKGNGVRSGDKYRRKLADLESQLVLASPNLVFRIGNKATNKNYTFYLSSEYERTHWMDSILTLKETCNIPGANVISALEVNAFIVAMQKSNNTEMGSYLMRNKNDESLLVGDLHMTIQGLEGLDQPADLYVCIEVDSYGHYFRKAKTKMICRSNRPMWNESFVLELEGSQNVRILLYEDQERPKLRAKYVLKLSRNWLEVSPINRVIKLGETMSLNTVFRFVPGEVTLRRVPISKPGALFGAKMTQVLKREDRDIPFIITACIREVERRGMSEVGIYRVSGSASDLAKLKKSFETNNYEAEQLLKEVDIHSVTGILKSYLRELPEALFSDQLYPKFFETFGAYSNNNEQARISALLKVFEDLPQPNKATINHILDHLIRVHQQEVDNKMSLHNLAMVFGPTLLRPGQTQAKQKDLLASSTVDVMAQAGILYCFLQSRIKED